MVERTKQAQHIRVAGSVDSYVWIRVRVRIGVRITRKGCRIWDNPALFSSHDVLNIQKLITDIVG